MPETLDYRTPEWLAEQLDIDKNAVYRYLNEGTLPGLQLGRKWLISESTVLHFLKAEEERQTTERRRSQRDRFAGFTVESRTEDLVVLGLPDDRVPAVPRYVRLVTDDTAAAPSGTTQEMTL